MKLKTSSLSECRWWCPDQSSQLNGSGADNITAKRPGTGISPVRWDEVLGQVAQKDYEKDELI